MVLTAGLGSRLRPLSLVRAKPAVPVAGTPLVGRILRWLAAAGVRDAVLNLHHRPETITAAVGDGSAFGVHVRYSWEQPVLGSAGGPARALPLLASPRFWLINGDTMTDVDLAAMARQHVASGAKVTMALVPNPDPAHYGGVSLSPEGAVTGFTPRGPENRGWHFIGVQAVDAEVFASLDPTVPADSVNGRYRDMLARTPGAIRGVVREASFHDIGTAADYLETSLSFARREGNAGALVGASCAIAADARLEDCVLWDRVTIGHGAALSRCVVADDAHVPAGAVFADRVIVPLADRVPGPGEAVDGQLQVAPIDAHRRKDHSR
jgi:NDP-sugar pyrophosphorylase family protein